MTLLRNIGVVTILWTASAHATEFQFHGYVDGRVISTPDDQSWMDGGFGKFRYGSNDGETAVKFAEAVGEASIRFAPELSLTTVGRITPEGKSAFQITEAYFKYKPVSTTPWRWSLKGGAFFPPVSLENTEVGWTSPWTLTPSAVNTWIGEELRAIGGAAAVEYRWTDGSSLSVEGSVFGWNDPAGILVQFRGWAMHDRVTGLWEKPRLPDALAAEYGRPIPWNTPMFKEIDNSPGWYLAADWRNRHFGHLNAMRYDNEADPTAFDDGTIAWRTEFWSAGYENTFGPITVIAQGLTGETEFDPFVPFTTDIESGFVLIGLTLDQWRFAARVDGFESSDRFSPQEYGESGHAYTVAANWEPRQWLRLTAEGLRILADRPLREDAGLPDESDDTQLQLSVRLYH